MVATTDGEASRQQVLKLVEEKDNIERQISDFGEILRKNNVGFDEPLVDSEGFPRNDIDVRSVRIARNKIICLQNDLKKIIRIIDVGLEKYFSETKDLPTTSSPKPPNQQMQDLTIQDEQRTPFLIVTLVDPKSPGDIAGIKTHDKILQFGNFSHENFINLAQIGELVKNNVNKEISLKVQRNGSELLDLTIKPSTWEGPGLLGFKINAIP